MWAGLYDSAAVGVSLSCEGPRGVDHLTIPAKRRRVNRGGPSARLTKVTEMQWICDGIEIGHRMTGSKQFDNYTPQHFGICGGAMKQLWIDA